MDCSPPGYSVYGDSLGRILEWVAMSSSRGSSQPEDWTQVSCILVDYLPSEPPGKPKTTGVGSLCLLQGIFPTQEPNQGLLHCRRILYQLSYREACVADDFTKNSKRIQYLFFSNYCKTLKKIKHLLTHLVGPTSPKGWYQRQSTKMKIIGEYLLWHLNRWLNGKEFKYQCKR